MSGHPDDDLRLVQGIAAGERQALTDLYLQFRLPLMRYLLQLTSDYGLAEELLQDCLVAVWHSAASFAGWSSVQAWLFGIARRQAHNTLRRRGLPLADASMLEKLPAYDAEPEASLLARATREELVAAFARLSAGHREVLVLVLVEETSYQETAQILGIPLGTIKSRLNAAKRALRALLDTDVEAGR